MNPRNLVKSAPAMAAVILAILLSPLPATASDLRLLSVTMESRDYHYGVQFVGHIPILKPRIDSMKSHYLFWNSD